MKTVIVKLFMIGVILLMLLPYMPGQAATYSEGSYIHGNSLYLPRLFNMTSSPSLFNQDPSYYSFEAYHLNITGKPVKVIIGRDLLFNDTGLKPIIEDVEIPSGNYSQEILNVSISEFNGTQYDRQVYIFADGVPIFWGSTQEIHNSTAESRVTEFENLLKGNVTFEMVIENFYDAKVNITGLYEMNVTLYLYPGPTPVGLPNMFVPLFNSSYNYSYVVLNPLDDVTTSNVSIPMGTYKAQMLLYEEGGGLDEFWYTNEPATREILIYYNNYLAGDLNPFETIYTGGIDLFYWKPLTSIDTLSFHSPYLIDLTPMLALSHNATIRVTVTNLKTAYHLTGSTAFDWDLSGVLMLWVNESNPMIGGTVVTETQHFIDSSPIFIPGYTPSTCYYDEGGNYLLNYTSVLDFLHGREVATTTQEGKFVARQSFNSVYESVYLDETFSESVKDIGMYNYTMVEQGNYPVNMYFDAIEIPLSSSPKIPFNLSYEQNGSLVLSLNFMKNTSFDDFITSSSVNEVVRSEGGFSGVIEVINNYGGSELVSLTSNYGVTSKELNLTFVQNGVGLRENFYAQGIQNSTVNTSGYYSHLHVKFSKVGDPIRDEQVQLLISEIIKLIYVPVLKSLFLFI
ncbi:peptide-N4-asparagine amidase [Sulfuracidifex tepidarius]|uniref:Peptide N-acetyl-beta-D-glucosaminyl asparaginase amidase A N-terminal domain-containing protein n=1 Tax=Sulfuracidifex tepidarius TaxID=1294262 RepID=A0A510E6Q5_9CREN|nr:peptide-N4-asparagine amidase [Sulfuracidifex tepidarius]BBG27718.1 hypothetical protein IC007_2272 [Sulfuracidifex tepidarius]